MTADAAHVTAVAEALGDVWATRTNDEDGSTSIYARSVDDLATVAVETLTPLIRAQERAKVAAEIRAAHRTAPDCCAYDTAARIAEGT